MDNDQRSSVATNLAPIAPVAQNRVKTVTFTRSREPSFPHSIDRSKRANNGHGGYLPIIFHTSSRTDAETCTSPAQKSRDVVASVCPMPQKKPPEPP